jgi:hypothetical protein
MIILHSPNSKLEIPSEVCCDLETRMLLHSVSLFEVPSDLPLRGLSLLLEKTSMQHFSHSQIKEIFHVWASASKESISLGEYPLEVEYLRLNTIYRHVSNPLKILMRILYQSNIDTFIQEENCPQIANILNNGLANGVFGYNHYSFLNALCKFIQEAKGVFFSKGLFPNQDLASVETLDGFIENWGTLPPGKIFALLIEGGKKVNGLEILPNNIERYYFDIGLGFEEIWFLLSVTSDENQISSVIQAYLNTPLAFPEAWIKALTYLNNP